MKSSYSTLMQSRFFNPAFNSAIFDGPVRIYFSQFHESLALKIYFVLQQKCQDVMSKAKQLNTATGKNVLIMLYPNHEAFQMSFDGQEGFLTQDYLEEDLLIGINGPFEDNKLTDIIDLVTQSIVVWDDEYSKTNQALA